MNLSRRTLIQAGAAVGGGLLVSFRVSAAPPSPVFSPNAWLKITPDNVVTFTLDRVEMGQGTMTSHAQLICEELEYDPTKLKVQLADADPGGAYANPDYGFQVTGGSTSTKTSWDPLRSAGATARRMLESAAAATWSVPVEQCTASNGAVTAPGHKATFGELCEKAATMRARSVAPKTKDFKVIGQSIGRLDARAKVTGLGQFGIDVKVKGALTAVVVRCPVPGGTPRRHDDSAVKKMPGVKHVVTTPNGIAILADNYWNARNAAAQLKVQWNEGPVAHLSTRSFTEDARALAMSEPGQNARSVGDVEAGKKLAAKTVHGVYEVPWVAHAPMEPINATADVKSGHAEVWASTQSPASAQNVTAKLCGLTPEQVTVHQTLVGGGFGRRIAQDMVAEAVFLSKTVKAPVKVQWSREDDVRNGIFRPAAYNVLEGGVSERGDIAFWQHKIVSASIMQQMGPQFVGDVLPFGAPDKLKSLMGNVATAILRGPMMVDPTAVEGAATFNYDMANVAVRYVASEPGVPLGFLRSVGHSHNGFIVESFVDELAALAGKDPFEFRRAMLGKAPRNRGVLELVAEKSGWGKKLPDGHFHGIAQHHSFDSWAAAVAEVSVEGSTIKVHKITAGIDCGTVVNPGLVKAQLESATVFGLSMALKQRITFDKGRVVQSNFHDYPVIRMNECPVIESFIVESTEKPTGVGEPLVPVIPPAVGNAVFAATGKRLRALPLTIES
jgi:isoquinoline 1-oxidoreductase beta subunit